MKQELENLKQEILKHEVISFDIFDTLLLRNLLKPTDLFLLMEPFAREEFGIEHFFKERIDAEKDSRVSKENNETTLKSIYSVLEKKYSKNLTKLLEKELELEEKFLTFNPFMKEIYQFAKEHDKTVLAISDMYLPKSFIEKILSLNGYSMDYVYVSCESQKVKGNGSLFQYVFDERQFSKNSWLHIGDNLVSDVNSPKSFGIDAFYYPNVLSRSKYENISGDITESIIKGILQNIIYTKECSPWERFGIFCVAPVYYGFTNWIYQLTKHKDNIYFLARDSYMVQKIYELFAKKLNKNMDMHYLYCSRASYQIPTLILGSKDLALDVLTRFNAAMNQKVKIESILNSIGLNPDDYEKAFRNFHLEKDTILTTKNVYHVQKFLSYIYDDIVSKLKEKKDLVEQYLEQMKMKNYEEVNLVDIGWAGSTQYALSQILKNQKITGYYLGTRKKMYENVKYNSFGYLFDAEEPEDIYKHIDANIMMYEFIFSAPHGTTTGFIKKKGKIEPVLEDFSQNVTFMNTFQQSAFLTCQEFLKYYDELKYMPTEVVLQNYQEFILNKRYEDLVMFSSVYEAVGYEGGKLPFVQEFEEEEVKKDLKSFYETISASLWKDAYLIKGANKEEYEFFKQELFSTKTKICGMIKSISFLQILRAIRYPRTTIRKIKSLFSKQNS